MALPREDGKRALVLREDTETRRKGFGQISVYSLEFVPALIIGRECSGDASPSGNLGLTRRKSLQVRRSPKG
jgi:hypothetical protein